ncbi:MAG: hypothetical protein Q9183_005481 [Haloplaca sp. 2 TL-2023]
MGTSRYRLTVRQQPMAARACGMGERDRRCVDPPPVVQLSLTDFDPSSQGDVDALRNPYNIVHCALIDTSGFEVSAVPDPQDPDRHSRRIMGTNVASPFVGTDPAVPPSYVKNANLGCFFVFHDISCRQMGSYRFRFTITNMSGGPSVPGSTSPVAGSVYSDIFEVFSAKDFPGMRASTNLIKDLKRQGLTVSVKKGSEVRKDTKVRKGSDPSAEDTSDRTVDDSPRRRH